MCSAASAIFPVRGDSGSAAAEEMNIHTCAGSAAQDNTTGGSTGLLFIFFRQQLAVGCVVNGLR